MGGEYIIWSSTGGERSKGLDYNFSAVKRSDTP
jgi:hypothetical protein